MLNSFKCSTTDPPFDIFVLNNQFIRNTLLEVGNFSYSLANAFIKSSIQFSFEMLKAINATWHSCVVPSASLSRTSHSSPSQSPNVCYSTQLQEKILQIQIIFHLHLPQLVVMVIKVLNPELASFCNCSHSNQEPSFPVSLSTKWTFNFDTNCQEQDCKAIIIK